MFGRCLHGCNLHAFDCTLLHQQCLRLRDVALQSRRASSTVVRAKQTVSRMCLCYLLPTNDLRMANCPHKIYSVAATSFLW